MLAERILLLVPHPDDEVVGCAAAIGRAVAEGGRVFVFYLTNGVPARTVLWPWQRASHPGRVARRWREAVAAAARLGLAEAARQDIPTRTLKAHLRQASDTLRRLVEELRPGAVWAPAYEGGHQDHDVANFLASLVRRAVPVWEFSEYNYAGGRVRSHEFPAAAGTERVLALDPAEAARKRALLGLYASERANLRHVGCRREVFRPLVRYDYTRPPHAGPLFYQRFQWVPRHPRVDHCRPVEVCRAIAEFAIPDAA
ncbi:MAG: PIG-L family deacetylase [Rhodospirillaceae bacterium]|nr:PIG-L family deacetylase [Rhodospirillaceae bacterium]